MKISFKYTSLIMDGQRSKINNPLLLRIHLDRKIMAILVMADLWIGVGCYLVFR
jgi:hypothetical protein